MAALPFDILTVGDTFPVFALRLDLALAVRVARLFGESPQFDGGPAPAMLLTHFAHVRRTLPGDVPDGTVVLRSHYAFLRPVPVGTTIRFRTAVIDKSERDGRRRVMLGCSVLDAQGETAARLEHVLRWGTS